MSRQSEATADQTSTLKPIHLVRVHPHLFAKLFCQPVIVTEPVRFALESALLGKMGLTHTGDTRPPEVEASTSEERKTYAKTRRIERVYSTYGNVAVIEINGVIDKHLSDFEMDCYGGYDLSDFDSAMQVAAADPKIDRVLLNINSPGGSAIGVAESGARVAAMTKKKEVHAFVDAQACSAAYWIASQADHIAAAPSAIIGSIGVYMAILDESRALEMEGYKVELIKAGKFKAMGASFKPLTDEEREILQTRVDVMHADFRSAVKSGRRAATERGGHQTVADSTMEGQWFDARSGLENRLVDELTNASLDEYVAALI